MASRNPCYKCENAFLYRGRYSRNCKTVCQYCKKYDEHKNYLKSKQKYKIGEKITTLEELMKQDFVYFCGGIKHIEVIKSMQYRGIIRFIQDGCFYKAIKKEGGGNDE